MSETGRTGENTERPEGVTDPLLWKLALGVADAHEPDGEGGCRHLLCAGETWPCTPWNNAQRALQMAQGDEASPTPAQDGPAAAWSGAPVVPAARRARASAGRESEAAASAA